MGLKFYLKPRLVFSLGACVLFSTTISAVDWDTYISDCKQDIGKLVVPDSLQCNDGAVLPIMQNGLQVDATSFSDRSNFGPSLRCDNPPILSDVHREGKQGQCVPNSRLQTSESWNTSKGRKTEPGFVLLCRNYKFRSLKSQDSNPVFDDVAMIMYNPKNGASCFFQKLSKTLTRLPEVVIEPAFNLEISGTNVPSPFSSRGKDFWLPPDKIIKLNCAKCHDGYPFIRTPYIGQVKGQQTLPSHRSMGLYMFSNKEFQKKWSRWHKHFDLEPKENGEVGACMKCHRIGVSFGSNELTKYSTAEVKTPYQTRGLAFEKTHWMPLGANSITFEDNYRLSINKLLACNADPTESGCGLLSLEPR